MEHRERAMTSAESRAGIVAPWYLNSSGPEDLSSSREDLAPRAEDLAPRPEAPVVPLDAAAFDAAEAVIARGHQTFCEVGLAIIHIRDAGRDEMRRRGYLTFEDYMRR